jgi:predicted DNA-binding transcriptional regulator AlpA
MEAIQTDDDTSAAAPKRRGRPPGAATKPRDDIRFIFDRLSDDALIDDLQTSLLAGRSVPTIKRWRRDGKTPPIVMLNGFPRYRAGDIRAWLRGAPAAVAAAA